MIGAAHLLQLPDCGACVSVDAALELRPLRLEEGSGEGAV